MTFSYDPAVSNDVSKVRLLIGDKTDTGHVLEDEEIQFAINENSNLYYAAAACVDMMIGAMKNGDGLIDVRVETVSESGSNRMAAMTALKNALKNQARKFGKNGSKKAGVIFTGNSVADMVSHNENEDNPQSRFVEEQFDNPNLTTNGGELAR